MTQCKEIAKKLKKMLSIYSIEEKESELLPEFTEPFLFQETLFQQCRNAADSILGSRIGRFVDVHFANFDFAGHFFGNFFQNRDKLTAGTAPFGPKIDQDQTFCF